MTGMLAEMRRLLSSAALYAAAGLAQRGVGFLLIPVYTRVIDPREYGMLEILNAFSAVFFAVLTLGLASAINKCWHRDCDSAEQRRALLSTALLVDLPVLLLGAGLLLAFAGPVGRALVGHDGAEDLMPLVAASAVVYSVGTLVFATLRAQERAAAFGVLTLVQFVAALAMNVLFVVGLGWGVRGVLLGNLIAQAVTLPVALLAAGSAGRFTLDPRLARRLLEFGVFLVPVMLAGWFIDQSDRYLLGRYRTLEEVAVYGVGYKFGTVVDLAAVWPFQLAWPAFSFAISTKPGHREVYARTLTYFAVLLTALVLVLALFARGGLRLLVGPEYAGASAVVAPVALAYALNGVHYCLSPGVHLAGRTRVLPWLAGAAAVVKVGLNVACIPRWGALGAAWATVAAFLVLAGGTFLVAQRVYPIRYEYGRLAKILAAGILVWAVATAVHVEDGRLAVAWALAAPLAGLPLALAAASFLTGDERAALGRAVTQARARLAVALWPAR